MVRIPDPTVFVRLPTITIPELGSKGLLRKTSVGQEDALEG